MKKFSRILAVILALALSVCVTACHPQKEWAYTALDNKTELTAGVTTAQYLYALTTATLEAQQLISDANSDKTIEDYSKFKVEEENEKGKTVKTEYYEWINSKAEEIVRDYAASMVKKKELKLKLDESESSSIEAYANMYWQYYYQSVYEENGVSLDTYKTMYESSYYKNKYFLSIYDKDGTDPVADKTVSKTFYDNYELANTISITISDGDSADTETTGLDKDTAKKLLKSYKTRLANGEKFEDIYAEYTAKYDTENAQSDFAIVYGSEETDSYSEHFEDITKLKNGDVKIFTSEDETQMLLVEKAKIKNKGETYLESYRSSVLYQLKGEKFEEDFKKYYKTLDLEENGFALGRISAKKIVMPEANNEGTTTDTTTETTTETEEDHEGHDHE